MDSASLFISMIAGCIGVGYFVYGKRQARAIPMLAGVALCIIPFCIGNLTVLILACIGLTVAPFVFRL